MITEDYVSFETSQLLKEKGFDEITFTWYTGKGKFCVGKNNYDDYYMNHQSNMVGATDKNKCSAPTLQTAMKWLREEKNLHLDITAESFDDKVLYRIETILRSGENHRWFAFEPSDENGGLYPFYEEACEEAIKYCLKNLI